MGQGLDLAFPDLRNFVCKSAVWWQDEKNQLLCTLKGSNHC